MLNFLWLNLIENSATEANKKSLISESGLAISQEPLFSLFSDLIFSIYSRYSRYFWLPKWPLTFVSKSIRENVTRTRGLHAWALLAAWRCIVLTQNKVHKPRKAMYEWSVHADDQEYWTPPDALNTTKFRGAPNIEPGAKNSDIWGENTWGRKKRPVLKLGASLCSLGYQIHSSWFLTCRYCDLSWRKAGCAAQQVLTPRTSEPSNLRTVPKSPVIWGWKECDLGSSSLVLTAWTSRTSQTEGGSFLM
jgi:hypothetical protein